MTLNALYQCQAKCFLHRSKEASGRPLDLIGPPITLYNRVFSEFLENFENENLDKPSDIFNLITDLIHATAEFYNIDG